MADVAVIMPVFNRAETVGEAIGSALAQTHPGVEVHVVDDGSDDGTAEVLDAIAASERRVMVTHQANAGPAAARNRAIAGCGTEWITFLDSDDLMFPDTVAGQLAWLEDHPGYDGVFGGARTELQPGISPPAAVAAKLCADSTTWIFQTALIRRSSVEAVGGYDEALRIAEDTDLHWRLHEAGVTLGRRAEHLIVRRVFGDNLTYENPGEGLTLLELVDRKLARRRGGPPPE